MPEAISKNPLVEMNITKDNDQLVSGALEILEHIFIQCSNTNNFKNRLNTKNKTDREYNYKANICVVLEQALKS